MSLLDWMQKNNRSTSAVAQIVGVSDETVVSWKMGRSTPQFRHMVKIKAMTSGEVDESCFPPTHDRRSKRLGGEP